MLKIIHDPLVLYNFIVNVDYIVAALCGVLLHYIICIELEYANRITSVIVVSLSTIMTFQTTITTFSNETPTLFIMLIIILLIIKIVKTQNHLKRGFLCLTICILGLYSLTIHIRNIVFFLVIAFLLELWAIIKKEKNILKKSLLMANPFIFLLIGYIAYKFIPGYFTRVLFQWNEDYSMVNQEIGKINFSYTITEMFDGIFKVLLGNMVVSVKQTYGIIAISYFIIIKLILNIIKKRHFCFDSSKSTCCFVLFSFSALCYLIGLLGLCVTWMGNMRGTGYWRYYGTYATPMLALSFLFCIERAKELNKRCTYIAIISYSILIKLFLIILVPLLDSYFDFWFVYPFKQGSNNTSIAFSYTMVISLLGICILFYHFKRKTILYLIFFLACYIFPLAKGGNLNSYTANNYCDTGYTLINALADKGILSKETDLYFIGNDNSYMYYQYMMLENGVKRFLPENDENILVFSNFDNIDELTGKKGWTMIQLDNNEYVYSFDADLLERVEDTLGEINENK